MNRLVRGTVLLVAVAAIWSCEKDPTGANKSTISTVSADPSVAFVPNNDSVGVIVQALNNLNQPDSAVFTIGTVGAGLTVDPDTTYGHIIGGGNIPTSARFFVKPTTTTTFVSSSFQVMAGGASVTVPVQIVPATIDVAWSNPTPAVGDTVMITMPAGLHLRSATTVTAPAGQVVGMAPDSTSMSVVFGPGAINSHPTINQVVADYVAVDVFFTPTTGGTITTDTLGSFKVVPSTLSPNYGDLVTVTVPAPFKISANTTVATPGGPNAIASVAADSSSLVVAVGPNINGQISLDNLVISGATALGPYTLKSAGVMMTPVLTSFTPTFSTTTPGGAAEFTMTAPAGFQFLPTVGATIGPDAVLVDSVSASGAVAYLRATPNTSGAPAVTDVVLSSLTSVALALDATTTVNVGASAFTGTDDPTTTAPAVVAPASGTTITFADGGPWAGDCGGVPCLYYKLTVATGADYTFSSVWNNLSDLGVYVFDAADLSSDIDACDSNGDGSGAYESCTITLPAGNYIIEMQNFAPFYPDPDPTIFTVDISAP